MNKVKRWWVPVLLGLLLMVILAGVAGARDGSPGVAAGWNVITVPSAACVPDDDITDWEHYTNYVECETADCWFTCAFDLPVEGPATTVSAKVKKFVAYVYDNDAGGGVAIYLYKTDPGKANAVEMAQVKSSGASGTNPQVLADNTIVANPVRKKNGTLVWLYLSGTDIKVYGFRIYYAR